MKSHLAVVWLSTALAAAAIGCGGGDGGGSTPSKADYIRLADAICKKGNAELHAAEAKFFAGESSPSAAKERQYGIEVFVPNLEHQIAKLRELKTPEGDESAVKAIWDAAAAGLAELKAKPSSFGGAPPADFEKANKLAEQYGFKVCGGT